MRSLFLGSRCIMRDFVAIITAITLFALLSVTGHTANIQRLDATWHSGLTGSTVPAGSNRLVIFVTGFENNGDTDITGVSYGGVAMTEAVGYVTTASGFKARCEIWYLKEADIPTGLLDFVVTYALGAPIDPMHAAATFQNVDQTTPIADTALNQSSAGYNPDVDPIEATVNVVEDGMAIAGAVCGNTGTYSWGNGWTEGTDQTSGATTTMATAEHAATLAGTDTASADHSSIINRQVIVVASLVPFREVSLADHAAGQETDRFGTESAVTGAELFAFKLTNNTGSTITVDEVVFQLSSVTGISDTDFANLTIYVDDNGDGTIDGGETTGTVGGSGTVNAGVSTITFSTNFDISASTTVNYILKGDVSNLADDDTVTIDLGTSNVTLTSGTVGGSDTTSVTHRQCGSGKFSYRREITIDYNQVGLDNIGSLPATGFPVLISLSGDWLKTTTADPTYGRIKHANGYDIIFRESDGRTGLYHEIESYDPQVSVEVLDDWQGVTDFLANGMDYDPSPGTNRLVLIAVFAEEATATVSVDTVSLGGVALTKIDEQVVGTGYSNNVWLGYLKDADIPVGTAITVTWVSSNVPDGEYGDPIHVQACTLQNVDQTSPVGNSGKDANTSATSIGSSAGQLNVADGDMVVYATVAGQPGSHTEESGYTEHLELDGVANNMSDATASKSITGTGTEQPVADWSLSTRLAIVTAVINAADAGSLVVWVRIDSLSKSSDTTIYIYYGNKCIDSPTENPTGVWDDDYVAVWHLDETSGDHSDSTGNGNTGSPSVTTQGSATGKIDGADAFGGTDEIDIATSTSLDALVNLTAEAWVETNDSTQPNQVIISFYYSGIDRAYIMLDDPINGIRIYSDINDQGGMEAETSFVPVNDTWYHVVWRIDGTDWKIYINGDQKGSSIESLTMADLDDGFSASIGRRAVQDDRTWNGTIDEVRISNTARDPDWIRTSYNNQNNPGNYGSPGFYTVGDEEYPAPTAVDLISYTARGQDASVLVEWETAQEINNLGFYLYRSAEVYGSYTKLNRHLIPGLISSVSGQQYTYTDTDVIRGALYYYMLEDVDLSGTRTMHGPICADWDGDGIPDDYGEETVDDDSDSDSDDSDPEVEIPVVELYEVDFGDKDWTPSSNGSATWVKVALFRARQGDDGVSLEWETSYEIDILGFHVYREVDGKFYRVTADLVPGSVFKVGAGRELPAGQSYMHWDGLSEGTGNELYWLDSVELNGGRASFGPIRPEIYGQPVPKRIKARFRSIGKHQVSRARALRNIRALREELSTKPAKTHKSQVNLVQAVPEKPSWPRLLPGEEQWALAAQPGVKIYIKEDGWYRVGEPELVAAGLSPGVDPRYLQLYADGEEQCLMVTGSDDGRFDPEDAIEFYGTGLDTPFTDAHVYWLVVGSRPGRRLDTPFTDIRLNLGKRMRIPRGLRGRRAPLSFPFSVELKERTFYFAALTNGERENFFGSVISTEPVDQLLTVAHPDPSSPEDAMLEVVLQGATDSTHQIKILFNYVEVGEVVFSGQEQWRAEIEVPYDLLLEGDNIVTLAAQGGPMDVSLVDYIRLTYWRTYTADENALRFRAMGGEWISIDGFSSPEIQVLDITDPMRMLKVRGKVMTQDSGYAITVKVPGGGERSLMAFTEDKIKRPAGIAANLASSWHELSQGAEVIIIGHRDLFESVRFLKELREQQGWSVVLVDVEDLYDEFNFGAKSPWALKDFLAQAYAYWNPQPRFVVLVGDTSYDPRNYLGFGEFDLVPTKFVDTKYLKTASDDWFVDFDDDELPEMAVGRLPVESAEEATTVVSKIISYEGASGLMNEALLVADINDFFNFEGASGDVADLLPGDMTVSEIFRGQSPTARSDLLDSLNQGQLLVNYIGHGSTKIWKGNLLTSLDAWNLTNSPYLPFLVSMTCLNGFFQDPYSESMAETFLKAEQGGAVAVWTSSGLTDPEGQIVMNKELIRLLFNGQGLTIGEAIMRAKQVVTDGDIRKTWILFGDPTLRLK